MAQLKKRFAEQSEDELRSEMTLLPSQLSVDQFKVFKGVFSKRPHVSPGLALAPMNHTHALQPKHGQQSSSAEETSQPPTKRAFRNPVSTAVTMLAKASTHAGRGDAPAPYRQWTLPNAAAMETGLDSHRDTLRSSSELTQWHQYMQLREELVDT